MISRNIRVFVSAAVGFAGGCYVVFDIRNKRCSELHTFGTMIRQYFEYPILSVGGSKIRKKVEDDTINFELAQEETLFQVLQSNESTEYGMKYEFCDIRDKNKYVTRHPLTRYNHYKDYIGKLVEL